MLAMFADKLQHALSQTWHSEYIQALAFIGILLLILLRCRQEALAIVKSTLGFLFTITVLIVLSTLCYLAALHTPSRVLNEMAMLLMGVLTLRITGLTLFRVWLPKIGFMPPRILEDILLILAYIAWGMVRLSLAGVNLSGLVTTSAVITGIIAFSMQDTLGNILGGLALQLDDSISIGNWIKVDDISGQVIEVHWRHTAVRTRNGEIVVIPNSVLMKAKVTIVGSKDVNQWRRWVYFSLNIDIPPQRVMDSINKALSEAELDLVSKNPAPNCILMNYKDGLSVYAVRYWLTNPQIDDPTDSMIRSHIFAALKRQGYQLASPALDITMTSDTLERELRLQDAELQQRQQALQHIDLFSKLSAEECHHLAQTLTYAPFAKGDLITRQGAVAHWLYVLISGEVDIWYEINRDERKHLTSLSAGRVFGEMGLMTGEPRRATVIAKTDVECYRIDKTSFEHIIRSRPQLADEFARILMERNQQLVAVQGQVTSSHAQHHARLLDNIRRFFRLNTEER
ncbi:mechanosensitive ion channel family protein [Agitococcus lubricus]|uniref:Small-conductance mechanosensitive channel n=1 Tax=Agitococcus lubricus TaxID=1077255 RepID=A0A2T5J2U4_9GAMM|nr:mechanosensitive ion channel family protein [Agitococcus lubricus]PTQ90846.1 small-conductance mechanosensitive channel [Agitococcus lubricus]